MRFISAAMALESTPPLRNMPERHVAHQAHADGFFQAPAALARSTPSSSLRVRSPGVGHIPVLLGCFGAGRAPEQSSVR